MGKWCHTGHGRERPEEQPMCCCHFYPGASYRSCKAHAIVLIITKTRIHVNGSLCHSSTAPALHHYILTLIDTGVVRVYFDGHSVFELLVFRSLLSQKKRGCFLCATVYRRASLWLKHVTSGSRSCNWAPLWTTLTSHTASHTNYDLQNRFSCCIWIYLMVQCVMV